LLLSAVLLGARSLSLPIDISCIRGTKQQTRRTLLQRSIQMDRQTDGHRTVI